MSQENWEQLLNEALDACHIGPPTHPDDEKRHGWFFESDLLYVRIHKFNNILDKLLKTDVGCTFSRETLCNKVVDQVYPRKKSGTRFDCDAAVSFRASLERVDLREFRVLRELFGATLLDGSGPLTLGQFKVYDWGRHKTAIIGSGAEVPATRWNSAGHKLLIECRVTAREEDRAQELADGLFKRLDRVLTFLFGFKGDVFDIGVFNHRGRSIRSCYIFSEREDSFRHAAEGMSRPVNLDDAFGTNSKGKALRLVALLGNEATQYENQLLGSAEWLGEAMADPSPASAFIKATTALELLFSRTEKGGASVRRS